RVDAWRFSSLVAHTQAGAETGGTRGVDLRHDVRHEEHVFGRNTECAGDVRITLRRSLGSDTGVEVVVDQFREITAVGVREQQLLAEHAPRRVDRECDAGGLPSLERRPDVVIHLATKCAVVVATLPYMSLYQLEPRRFPVAIHQPPEVADEGF